MLTFCCDRQATHIRSTYHKSSTSGHVAVDYLCPHLVAEARPQRGSCCHKADVYNSGVDVQAGEDIEPGSLFYMQAVGDPPLLLPSVDQFLRDSSISNQ